MGQGEIATDQIELSPYLQGHKLTAFLKEQGIQVTSYMTLAYGRVLKGPVLAKIAAKHNATVAQLAPGPSTAAGLCGDSRAWPATCWRAI